MYVSGDCLVMILELTNVDQREAHARHWREQVDFPVRAHAGVEGQQGWVPRETTGGGATS